MAEQQQDAPRLLSELFAAPPEAEAAQVQLAAVQFATGLVQEQAAAAARATNGKKAAGQQAAGGLLRQDAASALLRGPTEAAWGFYLSPSAVVSWLARS